MQTFSVRGPSEGLFRAVQAIREVGVKKETRNGAVLEFPYPVLIEYKKPVERVLFYPNRDANPFFHLMEGLWMLAGRNDVEFVDYYNSRIHEFSDDGRVFHGAYGFRWRHHFDIDQLERAANRLTDYPNDRRTVVAMWDSHTDLRTTNDFKDVPCNTAIYFKLCDQTKKLDMTITNRSNDLIWGTFGANAVHMSMLHEYMAARIGGKVGSYYQFSNNLHAYESVLDKLGEFNPEYDPYLTLGDDGLSYQPPRLVTYPQSFDQELQQWFRTPDKYTYSNDYLFRTCSIVRAAWKKYKENDLKGAIAFAEEIHDRAWQKACTEWLCRRNEKRLHKKIL
tara:strand:+ start:16557 stop:17564 length:1008 start_codon:yes stop_codon:yes gene_type:complete